jgi:hypothetical protein
LELIVETQPQLQPALGIVEDHLWRRFARFKSATGRARCGELCAHFLDLRCRSEDGHKIKLDEYTFDVIGYSIKK